MEVDVPHPLKGGSFGGIKRVLQEVNTELSNLHSSRFITPRPSKFADDMMPEKSECDCFNKKLPGRGTDYVRPSVKEKMRSGDVIWNNAMMFNDVFTSLETPCVFTFHSDRNDKPVPPLRSAENLKKSIQDRLASRGVRAASNCFRAVCVSRRLRRAIIDRVNYSPLVIPNGADFLSSGNRDIDQDLISWDGGDMWKYVSGRVGMQIKGFASMGAAELEIAERLSGISDDELRDLYVRCSSFVSGGLNDGFGRPPVEANRFGKPAVVHKKEVTNGTTRHGENAFVCMNTEELMEGVNDLERSENLRNEIGESGFKMSQNFTWKETVKAYETEFEATVSN
jgi:Glycosyltransferase